jgi:hypothetical protein
MKRNILIEHKEVDVVCEENGPISMSYNVLLTTLEADACVKPIVPIVTAKSTLTCINCGKTNHSVETCHNKKKVPIVSTATIKSTKPTVGTKTQPFKIHICYPYIICSNVEHRSRKRPRKFEVHNMFRTKHVNSNATTTSKPLKIDNMPVNVVVVVATHNQ